DAGAVVEPTDRRGDPRPADLSGPGHQRLLEMKAPKERDSLVRGSATEQGLARVVRDSFARKPGPTRIAGSSYVQPGAAGGEATVRRSHPAEISEGPAPPRRRILHCSRTRRSRSANRVAFPTRYVPASRRRSVPRIPR